MGTNYYAQTDKCSFCGRADHRVHIGKDSRGWKFALHVTPALKTLEDWDEYLRSDGVDIVNEYGTVVELESLMKRITDRQPPLLQHPVDGEHCVGHSEGTYDYIAGEFS